MSKPTQEERMEGIVFWLAAEFAYFCDSTWNKDCTISLEYLRSQWINCAAAHDLMVEMGKMKPIEKPSGPVKAALERGMEQ